jgi:hypothetical protein
MVPTPTQELDRIEREIDAPLPALIRAFYLGAREFGAIWQEGVRASPATDNLSAQPQGWNQLCDDSSAYRSALSESGARDITRRGGLIAIPPAAEVFQKGHWIGRVFEVDGEELEIDGRPLLDAVLFNDLYPFDFVDSYHMTGLWYDRANQQWRAIAKKSACWYDYQTISVEDYVKQLELGLGGPRQWTPTGSDEAVEYWGLAAEDAE